MAANIRVGGVEVTIELDEASFRSQVASTLDWFGSQFQRAATEASADMKRHLGAGLDSIARDIRQLSDIPIRITADADAARREIQAVATNETVLIAAVAETGTANAELDGLAASRDALVSVVAETGTADAELDGLAVTREALVVFNPDSSAVDATIAELQTTIEVPVTFTSQGGGPTAAGQQTGQDFSDGMSSSLSQLIPVGIGAAFVAAISEFGALETNIAQLGVTADASSGDLQRAADVARQLGLDTRFASVSAGDAAGAILNLSKGGVDLDKSIDGASTALLLAEAGSIDASRAANIAAAQFAAFRLESDDLGKAVDYIVGAANASTAEVGDMADAAKIAAPAFALLQRDTLGGSGAMLEMNTALAALATRGLTGATAGQALSRTMIELGAQTDKQVKLWGQLDGIYGQTKNPEQYAAAQKRIVDSVKGLETMSGQDMIRSLNAELAQKDPETYEARLKALAAVAGSQTGPGSAVLRNNMKLLNAELAQKDPALYGEILERTAKSAGNFSDKIKAQVSDQDLLKAAAGSAAARLTELGGVYVDSSGQVKPYIEIIGNLRGTLEGMDDLQKIGILTQLFGDEGGRAAMTMLEMTDAEFVALKGSVGELGQAAELAEAKNSGLLGALRSTLSTLQTLGGDIAGALSPGIIAVSGAFKDFVGVLGPVFVVIGKVVSALFEIPGAGHVALGVLGYLGAFAGFTKLAGSVMKFAGFLKNALVPLRLIGAFFMANPIALGIAAAVALGVALVLLYKRSETFRNAVDAVARTIKGVAVAAFKKLVEVAGDLMGWFSDLGSSVMPVLRAAFEVLQSAVDTAWGALQRVGGAVAEAIRAFAEFGPVQAMVQGVMTAIKGAVDVVIGVMRGDWSAVWQGALTVVTGAVQAIVGAVLTLPALIVSALQTLPGLLASAFGFIGTVLVDAWSAGVTALMAAIVALPGLIGSALSGAFNGVQSILTAAWNALWAAVLGIDNLAVALLGFAVGAVGAILDGLRSAWPAVRAWFVALPGEIVDALAGIGNALIDLGEAIIEGFLRGVETVWPSVGAWFRALPGQIVAAVGSLVSTLFAAGSALINGLFNGAKELWNTVASWLGTVASLAVSAIGSLVSTLAEKGRNLISGLWEGAKAVWVAVTSWLVSLAGSAVTAIGDMASTLVTKGRDVITGFWNGAKDMWQDVVAWFRDLPDTLGNLAGAFAAIGRNLGNALAGAVKGIVNSVIGLWNNIRFTVPSIDIPGVGTVGGQTISVPQIPRLARGAIVYSATPAVFGEDGVEAAMPLSRRHVDDFRRLAMSPEFSAQFARAFPSPPPQPGVAAAFNTPVGPSISRTNAPHYSPTFNVQSLEPQRVVEEIAATERVMVQSLLLVP